MLRDNRIVAAILLSAPPFYAAGDPKTIGGSIDLPTLHITATEDDIAIPGYRCGVIDQLALCQAMGGGGQPGKTLAVFKGGSHSIFTDRPGNGGIDLNPKVKAATRDPALAFLTALVADSTADGAADNALQQWRKAYALLLANFEVSDFTKR